MAGLGVVRRFSCMWGMCSLCCVGLLVCLHVCVCRASPASLPRDILAHPLYKTVFGERNFLVTPRGPRTLVSAPFGGRKFEFSLNAHKLRVVEVYDDGTRLALVDVKDMSTLGVELPPRLTSTLFLHWRCEELGGAAVPRGSLLVLRPRSYADMQVLFLAVGECLYEVPQEKRDQRLQAIVER
jgi:hypothetical protein